MFKRELQVKMVKPKKASDGETEIPETDVEDRAAMIAHVLDKSITKIGIIVGVIVALNITGKVLVIKASK